MPHVYITGDKHGSYKDVERFCLRWNTSRDDLLIILGDNGVNYWGADDRRDRKLKAYLSSLPISFYMIKGNHDQRPSSQKYHIGGENLHPLFRGSCLVENSYPSLLFAPMYGACWFLTNGKDWKKAFVLGGAYSADKWYRLRMQAEGHTGWRWFPDEQMTRWEMSEAEEMLRDAEPEIILSHTCPFRHIPRDMFLPQVDQSTVDDSMERWMDGFAEVPFYKKWYCGHWHTDRAVDRMRFMYHDIIELE